MSRRLTYDVVIVGAGTAGCVLASRLSEDEHRTVALIEAGGPADEPAIADPAAWPALQGSPVDWAFTTAPQPHTAGRVHPWPRGRVIGGCSAINAMAHVHGHPLDFDAWEAYGADGWSFEALLPYFRRSEASPFGPSRFHGDAGPTRLTQPEHPHPVTEAYMNAGAERGVAPIRDHNGPSMIGPTLNTLTIVDGRRHTAADAYLPPTVMARPNLSVLADRLVDRVEPDAHGRYRVLHTIAGGRREVVFAERAIVLSAGAIGSPCILQRSGIGPADELQAVGVKPRYDLPGVGRNLHDHLLSAGNVYRSSRPVPPSRYQHSESLMYLPGHDRDGPPEHVVAAVVLPVVTEAFEPIPRGAAYTLMFGVTHPSSRGWLRITSSDPEEPPDIDPAYLVASADRAGLLTALDRARELGSAPALAGWRAGELLPTADDLRTSRSRLTFIQRVASTHHHPVGTCRIGEDELAVVDSRLRVRGTEGLYTVDASVIPTIPSGPINAAVLAIAERAADMLAAP